MNALQEKLLFVIGSPRSGSTLLARMLGGHSRIYGRPEPHLLTPLAHLGYYAKVDKAAYDSVLAAQALREYVNDLPSGEQDYVDACRAYTDILYERMLATHPEKTILIDKTPAYALVLDYITKLYPQAKYVVLTRHPLAIFSSYAESFFNGDYVAAHTYNSILERYVPAIADFLRKRPVPIYHVHYEQLVREAERLLREIFAFLEITDEPDVVEYGRYPSSEKGLGDPIGVTEHSHPTQGSIDKWAAQIAKHPTRLSLCRDMIDRLDPADLAVWGYPLATLWEPLERAGAAHLTPQRSTLSRYRLQRWFIVKLRTQVQRHAFLGRSLRRIRLGLDVLLRE